MKVPRYTAHFASTTILAGVRRETSIWLPMLLGIAGLTGSLVFSQALALRERQQITRTVQAQAIDLRDAIVSQMRLRLLGLVRLQREWEMGGRPSKQRWEFEAALAFDFVASRDIEWVDPSWHARWSVPPGQAAVSPNGDPAGQAVLRDAFERARSQQIIAATHPIHLPEGGKGMLVCLPIFRGNVFDGFIVGAFRYDQLMSAILPEQIAPGYSILVLDNGEEIFSRRLAAEGINTQWAQKAAAEPYGIEWQVVAWPSSELVASMRSRLPAVLLLGGLLMTLFLSLSVHFAQDARVRALQLAEANRELARSNAELEQFAYVASHDLKEPLHLIANCGQLLEREYTGKAGTEADELIRYTMDSVQHMESLIDDLLAYARAGSRGGPLAPVDSEDALHRALANLQTAIEETGAVVTCDPLPVVVADSTGLVQLFQNLVGNSLKFRSGAPPRIHVSALRNGPRWTFSVRDNGIGIDPKYAERIFVIFQRLHTRREYPGTGLGLAICKKIVERASGRIWVESSESSGANFCFTLYSEK